MAAKIILVILKVIMALVSVILIPFNALVESLVPDLTNLLNSFTTAITLFFGNGLAYIFYVLPPITKTAIILMLTFTIAYYTATVTIHIIVWVIDIAKRIREMFI